MSISPPPFSSLSLSLSKSFGLSFHQSAVYSGLSVTRPACSVGSGGGYEVVNSGGDDGGGGLVVGIGGAAGSQVIKRWWWQ